METGKIIIGKPEDTPIKNVYEIMRYIEILSCIKEDPIPDLKYLILNCYKIYEMHSTVEKNRIDNIILKIKSDRHV